VIMVIQGMGIRIKKRSTILMEYRLKRSKIYDENYHSLGRYGNPSPRRD